MWWLPLTSSLAGGCCGWSTLRVCPLIMSTLGLNYYILGYDASKILMVEIPETATVGALKVSIATINHIPAMELTVWKVSLPFDAITPGLTVDDAHAQELLPMRKMSSVFSEPPVHDNVHILVQASRLVSLNCVLLPGNRPFIAGISKVDSSRLFTVKILNTENVSTLKSMIKAEESPSLDHVPALALNLWKVSLPVDVNAQKVQSIMLKHCTLWRRSLRFSVNLQ